MLWTPFHRQRWSQIGLMSANMMVGPPAISKLARTEETFLRYVAEEDLYLCPTGEKLAYHYTNEENGFGPTPILNARQSRAIKQRRTTSRGDTLGARACAGGDNHAILGVPGFPLGF